MLSKFDGSRVVRVMPNTPMLIGKGCTVYCPGTTVTEEDMLLVKSILEVTGMCEILPEHMINAVGAVSASGPAFVSKKLNLRFIQYLIKLIVTMLLPMMSIIIKYNLTTIIQKKITSSRNIKYLGLEICSYILLVKIMDYSIVCRY